MTKKSLFSITERMFFRSGAFIKTQSQQQKNLIGRVPQGVQSLRHHSR